MTHLFACPPIDESYSICVASIRIVKLTPFSYRIDGFATTKTNSIIGCTIACHRMYTWTIFPITREQETAGDHVILITYCKKMKKHDRTHHYVDTQTHLSECSHSEIVFMNFWFSNRDVGINILRHLSVNAFGGCLTFAIDHTADIFHMKNQNLAEYNHQGIHNCWR